MELNASSTSTVTDSPVPPEQRELVPQQLKAAYVEIMALCEEFALPQLGNHLDEPLAGVIKIVSEMSRRKKQESLVLDKIVDLLTLVRSGDQTLSTASCNAASASVVGYSSVASSGAPILIENAHIQSDGVSSRGIPTQSEDTHVRAESAHVISSRNRSSSALTSESDRSDPRHEVGLDITPSASPELVLASIAESSDVKGFCSLLSSATWSDDALADALFAAARAGRVENIRLLVEAGTNLKAQTKDGENLTALHLAAQCGHEAVVRYLCSSELKGTQVDTNAVDKKGWTPLHCAAFNGHTAVVNVLSSNSRVDFNATVIDGSTAHDLAQRGKHTEIANALAASERFRPRAGPTFKPAFN